MGLAVVTNELEPANHLADGEEAEKLSQQDAASDDLRPRDVAHLLGVERLGEGLDESGGVLQLLPKVLEVGLEG